MQQSAELDMISAGLSDVGRTRTRNEDSFEVSRQIGLAVVCDGMGGHAGGDIASRTAAETIVDFVYEFEPDDTVPVHRSDDIDRTLGDPALEDPGVHSAVSIIRSAVLLANRRLITLNQERGYPDGRGMGTTVVGLWRIDGTDKIVAFHAGDSRLYRWRQGDFRQLTRDHSLYQAWLDSGARGQAPHRNIIVRALGTMDDVEPDVAVHKAELGDIYLLCSDGLTSMLSDEVVAQTVGREIRNGLEAVCQKLITLANEAGGHDNITVVLTMFLPKR